MSSVTLRNCKPPVGRALTADEQHQLFDLARTRPSLVCTSTSRARLAFYCGLRACEIKVLCWRDIDHTNRLLHVRRSKTPAGWRSPTLNTTCLDVLAELHARRPTSDSPNRSILYFRGTGATDAWIPSKPMTSWRTAWRSMRKAAGLVEVRFHDGRHTAITTLAEKGLADWVIQAQVGHVAPSMMKTYSHIRRQALNKAADALEPAAKPTPTPAPKAPAARVAARTQSYVTVHVTIGPSDRSRAQIF